MPQKGQITHNNEMYYLRKQGAYYGHDAKGYVSDFIHAGRYTKEDAELHCKHCELVSMHLIDIDRHNEELQNRINDLLRLKIYKI
jgi:hypothetical protein